MLAPTRELATQIQDEAGKFGGAAGYHSACAYGGAPKRDQLREIQSGASILVATPGRLNDFLDSNQIDLSQVKKSANCFKKIILSLIRFCRFSTSF